jgi:hypothetical protein
MSGGLKWSACAVQGDNGGSRNASLSWPLRVVRTPTRRVARALYRGCVRGQQRACCTDPNRPSRRRWVYHTPCLRDLDQALCFEQTSRRAHVLHSGSPLVARHQSSHLGRTHGRTLCALPQKLHHGLLQGVPGCILPATSTRVATILHVLPVSRPFLAPFYLSTADSAHTSLFDVRLPMTHGSNRARVSSVGMRQVSRIPNQRYLLRATIPYNPSRSTRGTSHPTRPTCQYQLR